MRQHPQLYEINALALVNRLSAKYNQSLTLATIPDAEWNTLAQLGFDLLWLMGVWQRSPESRRLALASAGLRQEFDRVMPGWTANDVSGSPFAVRDYQIDPALGDNETLQLVKDKLNHLGMGLILDFVPNHLAADHAWTVSHPEWFVQGSTSDVEKHPDWFFSSQDRYLAHGRDPHFPAWTDTVQVNYFSERMREALVSELIRLAAMCDGVRCDMAMLALNAVFEWVWGGIVKSTRNPEPEFWQLAIREVRKHRQDFLFIAEAYWGFETQLERIGFDFTYDKTLYDHLRWDNATEIMEHIREEEARMPRQAHFIENHDEPRAAAAFGRERSMMAAVITGTLPGLRFYQDGQLDGRTKRIPVQLVREPSALDDREIGIFYRRLLKMGSSEVLHDGQWSPVDVQRGWEGNESHRNIVAWMWSLGDERVFVAVNCSEGSSQAWLKVQTPPRSDEAIAMQDVLSGATYVRQWQELAERGLYVDLAPYRSHIMQAGRNR